MVLLGRNAETAWADASPDPALEAIDPVRGPGPGQRGMANVGARQRLDEAFDEVASRLRLPATNP